MIFVLGGRGRLGQAICYNYASQNPTCLERNIYENWWQESSASEIEGYFGNRGDAKSTIFVASGILDPKLPRDLHLHVNYQLPVNIIRGVERLGMRVATFGTIMEQLPDAGNSYIASKTLLGKHVAEASLKGAPVVHYQIHTLYGQGLPSAFMFLGQILNALMTNTEFRMTLGLQLREYHHIADCVRAIRHVLETGFSGVTHISHGRPLSLNALATHIFRSFEATNLLKIGALPEPLVENYEMVFERPALLQGMEFRETLSGIVTYLKACSEGLETPA